MCRGGKVIRTYETFNGKVGKPIRRSWRKGFLAIIVLISVGILIWVVYERLVIGGGAGGVFLAIVVLISVGILIWVVYERLVIGRWPDWTGFGGYISPRVPKNQTFERGKTLWDLMQLLIIPAVLAVGAYYLNESTHQSDQAIAEYNRQKDIAIANDNRQEDALQTYIDRTAELLIKENLSESKNVSEVRVVARARTLTVLRKLDGNRRGALLRFLYEADLINKDKIVINLERADLSEADLFDTNLSGAYLDLTDLSYANLSWAGLDRADLVVTNLSKANLRNASLDNASLGFADLRGADLRGAYLNNASLGFADLRGADLRGANLSGAKFNIFTIWPEGFDPDAAGAMLEQFRALP